ncbi:MAG: tetratricopeptide repeat protein [Cyclobacteriaceae bacterium]
MKTRSLILIALMIGSTVAFAQKKKKKDEHRPMEPTATEAVVAKPEVKKVEPVKKDSLPQVSPITQHFARKYATALQWNDYEVAKDALYDLIIENPGNDSLIFDLAVYYYQNQKSASAVLVSNELLARNPKNVGALEIAASGYETLGVPDKALQNYESLYLLTNNVSTLYKMAFLQYRVKRYKESATSADIIMANKDIDTMKATYNDAAGKGKEYPIKVAVINLKGMLALDQGDKVGAKKFFEQALAISPDFALAKENLAKTK